MSTTRLIINQAIQDVYYSYKPGQTFDEPNLIFYTTDKLINQGIVIPHLAYEIHVAIFEALNLHKWLIHTPNGIAIVNVPIDNEHDVSQSSKVNDNIKAINNHICPHCQNTRVSKTEINCWLCGNKL